MSDIGNLDLSIAKDLTAAQRSEITEHFIYSKLSAAMGDGHNSEVLKRISADELRHYNLWKEHTGKEEEPDGVKVSLYYLVSRLLGITFGMKLMERGEKQAQSSYRRISASLPVAADVARDEDEHEKQLIGMIDEERLNYVGSIIRGLNDALVELTGALAGLTFALREPRLIAAAGLITGVAASFALGGTEYLATRSESSQSPVKAALYTGLAHIVTMFLLVFPYLVFHNLFAALGLMTFNAVVVILAFNLYVSVARELPFWKRFAEMALLGLGVAAILFGIGFAVRELLGVEV